MSSTDQHKHHKYKEKGFSAVCPAVADQSNTGAEGSTAFRALVNFLGSHGKDITLALKQLAFFLRFCYSVLLEEDFTFVDFAGQAGRLSASVLIIIIIILYLHGAKYM